jgi:hypothetical protein
MASSSPVISYRPPRRRPGLLTWIAVVCVVAVLIEVGAVTNGFGLAHLLFPSKGTSPGPSGPNPNPYNETILAVTASIVYGTGRGEFPALQGTDLCNLCPALPLENASYDPPVAGFWFFFNVTNEGTNGTHIGNFTLGTSGSEPHLFRMVNVVCCSPRYEEVVTAVYFTPVGTTGSSFGLAAYVIASSIPPTVLGGYTLYFNSTSP